MDDDDDVFGSAAPKNSLLRDAREPKVDTQERFLALSRPPPRTSTSPREKATPTPDSARNQPFVPRPQFWGGGPAEYNVNYRGSPGNPSPFRAADPYSSRPQIHALRRIPPVPYEPPCSASRDPRTMARPVDGNTSVPVFSSPAPVVPDGLNTGSPAFQTLINNIGTSALTNILSTATGSLSPRPVENGTKGEAAHLLKQLQTITADADKHGNDYRKISKEIEVLAFDIIEYEAKVKTFKALCEARSALDDKLTKSDLRRKKLLSQLLLLHGLPSDFVLPSEPDNSAPTPLPPSEPTQVPPSPALTTLNDNSTKSVPQGVKRGIQETLQSSLKKAKPGPSSVATSSSGSKFHKHCHVSKEDTPNTSGVKSSRPVRFNSTTSKVPQAKASPAPSIVVPQPDTTAQEDTESVDDILDKLPINVDNVQTTPGVGGIPPLPKNVQALRPRTRVEKVSSSDESNISDQESRDPRKKISTPNTVTVRVKKEPVEDSPLPEISPSLDSGW